MEKVVITNVDGTKFFTMQFGKAALTDNINVANTYDVTDRLSHAISAYSLYFGEQLKSDSLNKYYTPIGL